MKETIISEIFTYVSFSTSNIKNLTSQFIGRNQFLQNKSADFRWEPWWGILVSVFIWKLFKAALHCFGVEFNLWWVNHQSSFFINFRSLLYYRRWHEIWLICLWIYKVGFSIQRGSYRIKVGGLTWENFWW